MITHPLLQVSMQNIQIAKQVINSIVKGDIRRSLEAQGCASRKTTRSAALRLQQRWGARSAAPRGRRQTSTSNRLNWIGWVRSQPLTKRVNLTRLTYIKGKIEKKKKNSKPYLYCFRARAQLLRLLSIVVVGACSQSCCCRLLSKPPWW